eukprot:GHVU01113053.1.p2 GENE.GHVU01113053.1~~GHVU01113053.1.p2  ORF type:complete len:115 (+),score=1.04 GHVU01113053.1:277-621(+)
MHVCHARVHVRASVQVCAGVSVCVRVCVCVCVLMDRSAWMCGCVACFMCLECSSGLSASWDACSFVCRSDGPTVAHSLARTCRATSSETVVCGGDGCGEGETGGGGRLSDPPLG